MKKLIFSSIVALSVVSVSIAFILAFTSPERALAKLTPAEQVEVKSLAALLSTATRGDLIVFHNREQKTDKIFFIEHGLDWEGVKVALTGPHTSPMRTYISIDTTSLCRLVKREHVTIVKKGAPEWNQLVSWYIAG